MEKKTSNNFSTNVEKCKEFLLKKATSFFNKKRITIKDNSDLENFELLNSNNCEFNILNDFSMNFLQIRDVLIIWNYLLQKNYLYCLKIKIKISIQ